MTSRKARRTGGGLPALGANSCKFDEVAKGEGGVEIKGFYCQLVFQMWWIRATMWSTRRLCAKPHWR